MLGSLPQGDPNVSLRRLNRHGVLALAMTLALAGCASTESPTGATAGDSPEAYARGEGKGRFKPYMGDFWAIRASYPTGEFQPAWVAESIAAFHAVPEGLPAGTDDMVHRAKTGKLALNLPADQFTPRSGWSGATRSR